jgi:hypothetical protein
VTLTELKAFLDVILNMGMNRKPELKDYFSEDWLDRHLFLQDAFTRDQLLQIFWMFHVETYEPCCYSN